MKTSSRRKSRSRERSLTAGTNISPVSSDEQHENRPGNASGNPNPGKVKPEKPPKEKAGK